jgi:hypothetical protein
MVEYQMYFPKWTTVANLLMWGDELPFASSLEDTGIPQRIMMVSRASSKRSPKQPVIRRWHGGSDFAESIRIPNRVYVSPLSN